MAYVERKPLTPQARQLGEFLVRKFEALLYDVATSLSERDSFDSVERTNFDEAWRVLCIRPH